MNYRSLEEALIQGIGVERAFVCEHHDDHNASASVNSLTGYWICYACGARGKVDITTMEVDYVAVQRYVNRALEATTKAHQSYPEGWLDLFDSDGPGDYWLSRFAPSTCREFRLGHDSDQNPLYPLRDNRGTVLGTVRRRTASEGPKYRYPSGIDVTNYLFGFDRLRDGTIFLVEGATDAIAVYEATGNHIAAGTYGDGLSRKQLVSILEYYPRMVVLAQDQDTAGHEAAWKAGTVLHEAGVPVRRLNWDTWKDLAEMPIEARRELLVAAWVESEKLTPMLTLD